MCTYLACVAGLLAALILAEPVCAEEIEPSVPAQSLCPFIRFAANQTEREVEARIRMQEAETFPAQETGSWPSRPASPFGSTNLPSDRQLFEWVLVNWTFFEDLAPEQRAIIQRFFARCDVAADRPALAASIFGQLNASQRTTFVAITHALLHTLLPGRDGKELGKALGVIEDLIDIQGENIGQPSDQQFQLIVRLAPDARERLERAAHFEKGENHIFHKDYPISFRQFRRIWLRGQEAGLHFCLSRDGRFAQIHIDYRFGLLHLGPANSDVRADGNHQRHADRWPEFNLAVRPARVPHVVLSSQNLDLSLNSPTLRVKMVIVRGDFQCNLERG